jgi:hypothetical protein
MFGTDDREADGNDVNSLPACLPSQVHWRLLRILLQLYVTFDDFHTAVLASAFESARAPTRSHHNEWQR